ncbi:hypothetical protein HUU42_01795 [bacterium]|nr:hypothetical protein [bacterium]
MKKPYFVKVIAFISYYRIVLFSLTILLFIIFYVTNTGNGTFYEFKEAFLNRAAGTSSEFFSLNDLILLCGMQIIGGFLSISTLYCVNNRLYNPLLAVLVFQLILSCVTQSGISALIMLVLAGGVVSFKQVKEYFFQK